MKTTIALVALTIYFSSCQSHADTIRKTHTDSSTATAIPTPTLPAEELKKYHDEVASFIDNNLSDKHFSGGILVAKNGVIVYERYSGFSNPRTKDSVNQSTSFQIASTGKTLTSAAILKLVQEGKMNLDDLVTKYFPTLPYPDITVKMLLDHRSGLPNYLYYMEKMGINRRNEVTNEDVLNSLINGNVGRAYAAGKRFNYCNTNYVLLALIVEKVSGMPYPQYMQENFFVPLGMSNSFVKTKADSATVNYSYQFNGALWPPDFSDGPYGDKNIYSTVRDLLKWDQALYNGRIITPAMQDSAFQPYSNEKPGIKNYGLGWHLLMLPSKKKVIYHHGKWHGFNAIFARLTDERVTIIMTGNKANMGVYQIAKKMYNIFGPYDGTSKEAGED